MIASTFFIEIHSLCGRRRSGASQSITHARATPRWRRKPPGSFAYLLGINAGWSASFLAAVARPVAEKAANPLHRLADRLEAVGIGKPDVILAECAKAGAGDRRHPFLVEQPALKGAGVHAGPGN